MATSKRPRCPTPERRADIARTLAHPHAPPIPGRRQPPEPERAAAVPPAQPNSADLVRLHGGNDERRTGSEDLAERLRRVEEEMRLHADLTQRMGSPGETGEVIAGVIELVCRRHTWEVGELWAVDPTDARLHLVGAWRDAIAKLTAFDEAGRTVSLRRGQGLAGRAWSEARAVWVADVTAAAWSERREIARRLALRTGFAFPLFRGRDRIFEGAVALFTRAQRAPDPGLGASMEHLGQLIAVLVDRWRQERALREAADRYRRLFDDDLTGDLVMTPDGRIILCNQAFARIFGFSSPAEVYESRFALLQNADGRDRILEILQQHGKIEALERRVTREDGTTMTVVENLVAQTDSAGAISTIQGYVFDITKLKQTEKSLQRLSGRLLRLQDEERRHIARELHDALAQKLAAVSMNLALLDRSEHIDGRNRNILAESRALTDECAREMRTLSYLLHPPLLDEAGLPTALGWYLQGFGERSGIDIAFEVQDDFGRLEREVETALFRVVQESLINVHRHSGSRTAQVRLSRTTEGVILEIGDQGRGMTTGRLASLTEGAALGVGLRGMRERINQFGGRLDVESGGQGTTVRVRVPLAGGDQ